MFPGQKLGKVAFWTFPIFHYIAATMAIIAVIKSNQAKEKNLYAVQTIALGFLSTISLSIASAAGAEQYVTILLAFTVFWYVVAIGLYYVYHDPKKRSEKATTSEESFSTLENPMRHMTAAEMLEHCKQAPSKAQAVIRTRYFEDYYTSTYGKTSADFFHSMEKAGFNMGALNSPRLGLVKTADDNFLEFYSDFFVHGNEGYDFDSYTTITFTPASGRREERVKVKSGIIQDQYETRVTYDTPPAVIFVSPDWRYKVSHDMAESDKLHEIVLQVRANIERLKPTGVDNAKTLATSIAMQVSEIINSNSETTAQKIENLDKLRYKRLISDDDFKKAVNQILSF